MTVQGVARGSDRTGPIDGPKKRSVGGAPLAPPAMAYAGLALAGVVVPSLVAGLSPYSSDVDLVEFYTEHAGAAHLQAFLVLASSAPFAVFAAIASHRVRRGRAVPGHLIALVGGTVASVLLALSGLILLAMTRHAVADVPGLLAAMQSMVVAVGGTGFVLFSGLLLAGISVPGIVLSLLPRWVGWSGLLLAAVCVLATLTALTDALMVVLPIGRFGTVLWMLAVSVTLGRPGGRGDGQ